jgi:hypothetical protein
MRVLKSLILLLTVAVLIQGVAFGGDDDAKKAAKEAIKNFMKEYGTAQDEAGRESAVKGLGAEPLHESIAGTLLSIATKDKDLDVRLAAAKELAAYTDNEKVSKMILKGGIKANMNKYPEVAGELLISVGEIGCKSSVKDVNKYITVKDPSVARGAMIAAGLLRDRSSIEILLKELKKLDKEINEDELNDKIDGLRNGQDMPGVPDGVDPQEAIQAEIEAFERQKALKKSCRNALKEITGQDHFHSDDWEKWWKKVHKTFEVKEKKEEKK